jgi:penicillin amidase
MLSDWYFWQERFQRMMQDKDADWFDDKAASGVREDRDALILRAALDLRDRLAPSLGEDVGKWLWGEVHRVEFVSPIRREGAGKGLLGGGRHPAPGSVETLCRGYYDFNAPFDVEVFDSLRMVADLGDPDKVLAVLPGGVAGRLFHPHTEDQIDPFMKGEKVNWWFSDRAIQEHVVTTLVLEPAG